MEEKAYFGPKWRNNVFWDKFGDLKKKSKKNPQSLPYLDFFRPLPLTPIFFCLTDFNIAFSTQTYLVFCWHWFAINIISTFTNNVCGNKAKQKAGFFSESPLPPMVR